MKNELLAKALGVNVRTIQRDRAQGLPMPAAGESVASWSRRARKWKRSARKTPGPRPVRPPGRTESEAAVLRWQEARAERAAMELAKFRAGLHSRCDCEAGIARRVADVQLAFKNLGSTLARLAFQAPSPDAIQAIVNEEVSRLTAALRAGPPQHDTTPEGRLAP